MTELIQEDLHNIPQVETKETRPAPIEPNDKAIWAASGIDISLNRLESIQKSFLRSAELFRDKDLALANRFFIQCLDGLERFFEAIVATKAARKLDFSTIKVNEDETLQVLEGHLVKILQNTLTLQENKDFTAISDKIEYELITNLHAWNAALRKLRISFNSNC